jgi:hypothetical protein
MQVYDAFKNENFAHLSIDASALYLIAAPRTPEPVRQEAKPRPCERQCQRCRLWKHHSRFHIKTAGNSTVARFDPVCRDCQQMERNEICLSPARRPGL